MSEFRAKLSDALKEAQKAKDELKTGTLRLVVAAIKDKDIDARGKGNPDGITDGEVMSLLQSMVKQRQESANIYKTNNRPELAEREEAEVGVIESFLPKQMSDAEAEAAIKAIIAEIGAESIRDMGKVMAELKTRFAGQLDMGKVGGQVKQLLG